MEQYILYFIHISQEVSFHNNEPYTHKITG